MAINDTRTPINAADSTTGWVITSGGTPTVDNDTYIEGSGSITFNLSNTVAGLSLDMGSAQSWAGAHLYVWFNTGIAGLLDTQAGGGLRVRLGDGAATAASANYSERYIGGSDTYTGGWVMFVIDIDEALSNADATNGTTPADGNDIRWVGIIGDTAGTMTKKQDNFFVDAMWILPASTPGITVEGQNTGSVDWTWDDIAAASESGAWGTCQKEDGVIKINTPIRFGANDATTHGFSDTSQVIAWRDWPVATSFYGLEVIGGSGTQSFSMGAKSGSGISATGSQGCVITADSAGARWYFDCDNGSVDACGLYGCTFQHGDDFQLDGANVETVSCVFNDCVSATPQDSALFTNNLIVNAANGDGVGFLTTDDISDITNCRFIFSDGHGVTITGTGSPQTSDGNVFTSFGSSGTNDAAIYNNSGASITINVQNASTSEHTTREGGAYSTTVQGSVPLTITVVDQNNSPIQNARVGIFDNPDLTEYLNSLTNASGVASGTYTAGTPNAIFLRVRKNSTGSTRYISVSQPQTISTSGLEVTVAMSVDTNAS